MRSNNNNNRHHIYSALGGQLRGAECIVLVVDCTSSCVDGWRAGTSHEARVRAVLGGRGRVPSRSRSGQRRLGASRRATRSRLTASDQWSFTSPLDTRLMSFMQATMTVNAVALSANPQQRALQKLSCFVVNYNSLAYFSVGVNYCVLWQMSRVTTLYEVCP